MLCWISDMSKTYMYMQSNHRDTCSFCSNHDIKAGFMVNVYFNINMVIQIKVMVSDQRQCLIKRILRESVLF